jgi:ribosomal protein S18 acetylase RimI-like enzyme
MIIKRITVVGDFPIKEINSLLDKGTTWDLEQGEKFLENPDNALFIAFENEEAVGFLTAYRLQRLDERKAEVLLYEISVYKDFRQKGIGKALVEKVKEWAKEVGADEVWVLTNKSNVAANALYNSAGGKPENPDDVMYVFKL